MENSSPLLTGLENAARASPDDPQDGRIVLTTRAAPRSSVQVDWSVYQQGLLPTGITRDHYEVELDTGSQLTSIPKVTWETDNPQDVRLRIWSQAQRPFRWFNAIWRVYSQENLQRNVIDELPVETL